MKKFFLGLFFFMSFFAVQKNMAMESSQQQDPLIRMNYRNAFDQAKIHEKFKDLMIRWGCAANVFADKELKPNAIAQFESELAPDTDLTSIELTSENESEVQLALNSNQDETYNQNQNQDIQNSYEKACLNKLQATRRWTITEQARESLTILSLMVLAAFTVTKMLDSDSLGGSFSIFAVIFNLYFY